MTKYKVALSNSEWVIEKRALFFFHRIMKYKKVSFYDDCIITSKMLPLYFATHGDTKIEVKYLNSGELKPITQKHYRGGKVFNVLR